MENKNVSLVATWWLKDYNFKKIEKELIELAKECRKEEGVLMYYIHKPIPFHELDCDNRKIANRSRPGTIVFFQKTLI